MAGFIFKITNVHVYVYAHTIWWIKRCIWIDKNICLRWQDYGGILYFFSLSLPPLEILQNTWGFHNNLTDVYVSSQFITKSSGWRWQCRSDPWTVFCLYRSEVLSANKAWKEIPGPVFGRGRERQVWGLGRWMRLNLLSGSLKFLLDECTGNSALSLPIPPTIPGSSFLWVCLSSGHSEWNPNKLVSKSPSKQMVYTLVPWGSERLFSSSCVLFWLSLGWQQFHF